MAVVSQTRVCIKNLPQATTEQDLKEFLQETGNRKLEITDCKVLKNAKGKSRKVAFVGFRHTDQAKYVVDTFHQTFLRTSRLSVEPAIAKTHEAQLLPIAKKKPIDVKESKTQKKEGGKDSLKQRQTEEFLRLMGGGKKSKFWANDEEAPVAPSGEVKQGQKSSASADESTSNSESIESDSDNETKESHVKHSVEQNIQPVSDMDFLRSKQSTAENLDDDSSTASSASSSSSSSSENGMSTEEKQKEKDDEVLSSNESDDYNSSSLNSGSESEKDKGMAVGEKDTKEAVTAADNDIDMGEEISSQTRLFVRNLPFETTEDELEEYFSAFGKLVECHIPIDDKKRNKGFAFVTFVSANDALEARTQLDKIDFQGRLLHILQARPPPPTPASSNDKNMTWKQRQELARKKQETKNGEASKGWSASFVRGDAVVDNLAERLGLRKGDLLGVKDKLSSGDAAVRLALGETQIIEENREYFKTHGVDMDALVSASENDKAIKRSKTAILVKNLPYDTRSEELTKLFHVGEASFNLLLPPSRTIAMIEYQHSTDAKRAFRKLAYRRFKHVPIYLEWAPLQAKMSSESIDGIAAPAEKEYSAQGNTSNGEDSREDDGEEGISSTIYVKNLNFLTTEASFREVFEKHVGGVRSVKIPQKIAPVQNEEEETRMLSMGYGFVELVSHERAKAAMSKLQGKMVDGHPWELTISSRKDGRVTRNKSPTGGKNPTKLVVRNVPFQATRHELLKLFGTFGQLRKVRLPKKFDGTHRGFAFVEFITSKEALAAMDALSRTHLYGRHLVLEWATDDNQNIDKLREKAKRDTGLSSQPKNKKIRFN